MKPTRAHWSSGVALAAALLVASPLVTSALAAPQDWRQADVRRDAYDNGYRRGFDHGRDDARDHRAFSYTDERDYRNGDAGYRREHGNRDFYRQEFRRGYATGYSRGFGEVARPDGRYGHGPGYTRGYADGYDKGIDAARRHRAYEPAREGWYRSGDRGYERTYGPRDRYQVSYREGFVAGYQEAFRARGLYRDRDDWRR